MMKRNFTIFALLFLGQATLASAQGIHQVAHSDAGVIATAHPLATYAGQRVLEQGGNAADAAVAAAFAVSVVLPSMNSIGGRNQILVRRADGSVHGIDGTTQIPLSYDPETATPARHGYQTIGIPGVVAGLIKLHSQHGSLPLETLMAQAIEYAEHGFRLLPQQERFQAMGPKEVAESEGAAHYFLKADGSPYRAGELLVQTDLAATLRTIAADAGESFYRGDIAEAIARDMAANQGYVTARDLADYRAEDARIVRGSYRGYELVGSDIPSAGSMAIQALQILETFDRDDFAPEEWASLAGQAIRLASREIATLGSDTAAVRSTSKEWARAQALRLKTGTLPTPVPLPSPASPAADEVPHYTTHISVADAEGMVVSLTQTVGPVMGSKVATPGLGFHYAVTLGGYLGSSGPGVRARSFITPLIVLRDGAPFLVLGAAGGAKIISSVVQIVTRIIDDGLSLPDAMVAPRVYMGFNNATLEMETSGPDGWTQAQLNRVGRTGLEVRGVDRQSAFALVQALYFDAETGEWTAVSEPDGEGTAASPGGGTGGG
jgi:gamma-glutamyltranspeptidase / glutathione hydrolase